MTSDFEISRFLFTLAVRMEPLPARVLVHFLGFSEGKEAKRKSLVSLNVTTAGEIPQPRVVGADSDLFFAAILLDF